MDSAQVHKIIKARQYAQEPERFHVRRLEVELDGDDRTHHVELRDGVWECDCEYFHARSECAHTMALERVIGELLHARA